MGLFHAFFKDKQVRMIGVEAAGKGLRTGQHSASLEAGQVGVLHGSKSYLLQTDAGQVKVAHSIAAGLDYPGVGPEHAYYKSVKRATYVSVTDSQALKGLKLLSRTEGIIPAMETAHAIAYLEELNRKVSRPARVIVCLSGRGDKDVSAIKDLL